MLWVDKCRPKTMDQVIVHQDIAQNFKKLVSEQDCPHLLFYGPSGSGKKSLVMALLRRMFSTSAEKVKVENMKWKINAGMKTSEIELTTLSSTHHMEVNPSDAGFQDRYIVQEIIKEMTKYRPIDTKGKKSFKGKSNRSLRRAVLEFETFSVQQYAFYSNQAIPPVDWEEYVSGTVSDTMKEQSPKSLFQVRGKMYELLINCIPPEIILKRMLYELLRKLDAELKHEEHRMRQGQKAIFHLEALVAKFLSTYKPFPISTFG